MEIKKLLKTLLEEAEFYEEEASDHGTAIACRAAIAAVEALRQRVAELGKDYGNAVDKFDACRAALARRVKQDTGALPHPPDSNTQEWHEWLIEQSDTGAEAVEALQDICAGHEIDLKNSGSDNDDLRLEKEATEAREVELAGALEQVRQCCLFSDDDAGPIGVTTDPHIDEQLFKDICTALATTPAEALERASAKDAALKGIIVAWEHPPGGRRYSPREIEDWLHNNMKPAIDAVRALAKLDVLGREEKEDV